MSLLPIRQGEYDKISEILIVDLIFWDSKFETSNFMKLLYAYQIYLVLWLNTLMVLGTEKAAWSIW